MFRRQIGDVPILVTEGMAIGTRIRLARTKKVQKIEVESDTV